ncbi:hypothetical protein [Pseudomonas pudica]|uniref:Uncharacterized protein n=1 Tax=Pseudomonas pudica TaxID=272772 RepID=A0ABS0FWE7_9PSED|nr:hypothetical protein [Pseudomonas pudica]MBF8644670.1 hypothetical protein [Pseudomonas pudica]MBF8759608.1 hypothetical protein [Pseudomonas pudica]
MITFTQIWLHNLTEHDERSEGENFPKFLNDGSPIDIRRRGLAAFRTYLGVMRITDENNINYDELMAFRGFLNVTMQLEKTEVANVLRAVCAEQASNVAIDVQSAAKIIEESQYECNMIYLLFRDPTQLEIRRYESLFECTEANKVIRLDFGALRNTLNEEDFSYFSQLLAAYLSKLPQDEGTQEGNAICGLMQGLVTRHPNVKLSQLHLDENSSASFMRYAEYEAVEQAIRAGYSEPLAFENRNIVRHLLINFFAYNSFLIIEE